MATKAQLKKLLNKISADSRKAHAMAVELYGPEAWIYVESEGGIHAMSGDDLGNRQRFIELESDGIHQFGVGAW